MKKILSTLLTIVLFQNQAFCQLGLVSFPVLNAAHDTATNTNKFIETLAHEYAHNYTSKEGIANSAGSLAKFMWGIGNALNFTSINTSGKATLASWYSSNSNSSLLQENTKKARGISDDNREHSTLAYRWTKTTLNAIGIETTNRKSFEDNIVGKVFGLTIGTTDKAEERQENLLYGIQNAREEYENIPTDLKEAAGDIKKVPGRIVEEAKNTYNAKEESLKAATDIKGIADSYLNKVQYASINPLETANKLTNAIDETLFGGIRGGFNNDNLIYGMGQVFTGTINDLALVYGGANLLGSTAGKVATSTRGMLAYRYMTEAELKAINNSGGFLRGGNPGELFFTKDLYKSSIKAQNRLSLGTEPRIRVEFEILNDPVLKRKGSKVFPDNGQAGKGSEFMTTDKTKVRIINVQPLLRSN